MKKICDFYFKLELQTKDCNKTNEVRISLNGAERLVKKVLLTAILAGTVMAGYSAAQAATFNVGANSHSWVNGSNGNGLATGINLNIGDLFSVNVTNPADTWNLCSPNPSCEANADGYRVNAGTTFGNYTHSGFTAAYGTLVGRIGFGNFFGIGTGGFSGTASQTGELRLFNWDHNLNNSGSIAANVSVSAVPVPAALPLLAGGLGILGLVGWSRRRSSN